MSSQYPEFHQQQAGLEVVPPETGLYSVPTPGPIPPVTHGATHPALPKEYPTHPVEFGEGPQTPARTESQVFGSARRRILGLSVPVFWALVVTLIVVLAAGIGGGVGGGLSAQRKSASGSDASRFVTVTIKLPLLSLNKLIIDPLEAMAVIPAAPEAPRHLQPHHRRPLQRLQRLRHLRHLQRTIP